MPRSRSERRGGDEDFDVRLSWPSDPVHAPDRPGDEPAGGPAGDEPAGGATGDDRGEERTANGVETGTSAASELVRPGPMTAGRNRFGVEAFDRLAARVLERLAGMGEDLELALTAMRSEVAELRHAVDDVASRVEMRQMKAATEELRGDVNGLRRAVLEWPELEQVSSDVAGLRADLAMLLERKDPAEVLGQIDTAELVGREELAELLARKPDTDDRPTVAALAPLVEEVAAVRSELATVRRRMSVKAKPDDLTLTEGQIDQLVSAVVERLSASLELVSDDADDDQADRWAADEGVEDAAVEDEVLPVEAPQEEAPAEEPTTRRRSRSARRR